jgi:hypothetical protein
LEPAEWIAQMRLTWLGLQPVKSAVRRTVSPEARSATMLWWATVLGTRPAYLLAQLRIPVDVGR